MIHKLDVRSPRRGCESQRIAFLFARCCQEIDDVIVDHDGGHDHVRAAFARPIGEKARVNQHMALNSVNPFGGDVLRQLLDNR